jgi:ubiquinol-cytochrome c reductase subunit 6
MDSKLFFPIGNRNQESFQPYVSSTKNMIERGVDPKPMLIEFCEPMCSFWKEKLQRCEKKLEKIIKINPTKSCLYPMRDFVTCIEACVMSFIILGST